MYNFILYIIQSFNSANGFKATVDFMFQTILSEGIGLLTCSTYFFKAEKTACSILLFPYHKIYMAKLDLLQADYNTLSRKVVLPIFPVCCLFFFVFE